MELLLKYLLPGAMMLLLIAIFGICKRCPHCRNRVRSDTHICPHCRHSADI